KEARTEGFCDEDQNQDRKSASCAQTRCKKTGGEKARGKEACYQEADNKETRRQRQADRNNKGGGREETGLQARTGEDPQRCWQQHKKSFKIKSLKQEALELA
ncbi:MAG: hypothetical protein MPJ78_09260, partial [Hyphomicrobiaceae bacterium]|nr:hypothetical protein [Hyphomicrobiaceae bacterium]